MSVADLVFFDVWNMIAPGSAQSLRNAALILMAYFFESCDIFEDPVPEVH